MNTIRIEGRNPVNKVMAIGTPPWTRSEILDHVDEFKSLYADRPVKDNLGGMKAPHMFAVWFMARKLSPDLIVESGVWKGQSTWLLEKACPNAQLISIDLDLSRRQYISNRATYSDKDFGEQDWSKITDRSLVFFDDHQNAYKRLQQCKWFGFRHIIFEDNYPMTQGDCYSLKKAFACAGFVPEIPQYNPSIKDTKSKILRKLISLAGIPPATFTPQYESASVHPNGIDSRILQKNLEIYYEFPPVIKSNKTRWGDDWTDELYPTPEPLLASPTNLEHKIFVDEAAFYTWICYTKLKS